jgi:hypothetical protein
MLTASSPKSGVSIKIRISLRLVSRKLTQPSNRFPRLILTYLIPLQLHRGRLPSQALLSRFPVLEQLFNPFIQAIRRGDVKKFDNALIWAEGRLVEKKIWIAMERAREICLRGLLKHVLVSCFLIHFRATIVQTISSNTLMPYLVIDGRHVTKRHDFPSRVSCARCNSAARNHRLRLS